MVLAIVGNGSEASRTGAGPCRIDQARAISMPPTAIEKAGILVIVLSSSAYVSLSDSASGDYFS
jgi:hypothetical protein